MAVHCRTEARGSISWKVEEHVRELLPELLSPDDEGLGLPSAEQLLFP